MRISTDCVYIPKDSVFGKPKPFKFTPMSITETTQSKKPEVFPWFKNLLGRFGLTIINFFSLQSLEERELIEAHRQLELYWPQLEESAQQYLLGLPEELERLGESLRKLEESISSVANSRPETDNSDLERDFQHQQWIDSYLQGLAGSSDITGKINLLKTLLDSDEITLPVYDLVTGQYYGHRIVFGSSIPGLDSIPGFYPENDEVSRTLKAYIQQKLLSEIALSLIALVDLEQVTLSPNQVVPPPLQSLDSVAYWIKAQKYLVDFPTKHLDELGKIFHSTRIDIAISNGLFQQVDVVRLIENLVTEELRPFVGTFYDRFSQENGSTCNVELVGAVAFLRHVLAGLITVTGMQISNQGIFSSQHPSHPRNLVGLISRMVEGYNKVTNEVRSLLPEGTNLDQFFEIESVLAEVATHVKKLQ